MTTGVRPRYLEIIEATEADLAAHGDTHLGMGWTKEDETAERRYRVALELVRAPAEPATLLDFGCGTARLYDHLLAHGPPGLTYSGLDLSPRFLAHARAKHPHVTFYDHDVLRDDAGLPRFDYVVMNGVFNYKGTLSHAEMLGYCQQLLLRVFAKTTVGLSFNVMSKQVDWERDDLFHLPFDVVAPFLAAHLSPHFTFRHDYGLHEYTTYVYRDAFTLTDR